MRCLLSMVFLTFNSVLLKRCHDCALKHAHYEQLGARRSLAADIEEATGCGGNAANTDGGMEGKKSKRMCT